MTGPRYVILMTGDGYADYFTGYDLRNGQPVLGGSMALDDAKMFHHRYIADEVVAALERARWPGLTFTVQEMGGDTAVELA